MDGEEIPFRFKHINTYDAVGMNRIVTAKEIARRTIGGTSAAVASRSQMTPSQASKPLEKVGYDNEGELLSPTCFHRKSPRANLPPNRTHIRNKPRSMVTSKTRSVTSDIMTVCLVVSMLVAMQTLPSGNITPRS
jgi:hypothetical protein